MKLLGALLTMAVAMLLAPVSALAAPPSNDDFADREVLPSGFPLGLPIEVMGSNVEATKEDGEFVQQLAPAGHSVWFEWEADATEWVSVGLCGTGFPTIVDVFTGTEIDELTSVIHSNGSAGPDCSGDNRVKYTFKATSGTKYVVFVDGNSFFLPEAPQPITEGTVSLQIEKTQPPANDDFADAEPLVGQIDEEPGGSRFYFASARGNNWTATTELGEPSYGAGAGASVWYEWTVPVGGTYLIAGPCCGPELRWALFGGESIGDLTQLFLGPGSVQMTLTAGTRLKIAVFGPPNAGTGEPTMGSFNFFVSAELPPLPRPPAGGAATPPPPDVTPPETTIAKSRLSAMTRSAKFWFSASEPASGFLCKLDKRPFKACGSPRGYRRLSPGRHTFKVKAIDAAGNVDPTPAITRISLPERRPRR